MSPLILLNRNRKVLPLYMGCCSSCGHLGVLWQPEWIEFLLQVKIFALVAIAKHVR